MVNPAYRWGTFWIHLRKKNPKSMKSARAIRKPLDIWISHAAPWEATLESQRPLY